jgi:hypothetical protein
MKTVDLAPLKIEASPRNSKGAKVKRCHTIVYPWSSPIPVVFVEGDSSEMGKQFATSTRSITKKNVAFNLPLLENVLKRSKISNRDYVKEIEYGITKFTTSEYLDEMQSIAEAVQVPYESIILLNSNVDILSSLPKPESVESFSCSMFAAWGSATRNGSTIVGHNDDGNRIMDQYAVLKVARPKHGFPFACPQVPGYLAYDCLINSEQTFVCGTAVDDKMKNSEVTRNGVPNWVLYRWIGQFSKNASDATDRLLASKSMTYKNWCFISKKDGGRVIEATPKHHAFMRFPDKSKDWIGLSTCTVCPEISKHTIRSKKKTSGIYRKASVVREVSRRYGTIDSDSAVEILSSHYDSMRKRAIASEHTPCRHMEYENKFAGTCRCIVATFSGGDGKDEEPTTRIDISLGNPCNGYWRQLYFDKEFNLISGYDQNEKLEQELNRLLVVM